MRDTILLILVFAGFFIGIWFSYRLFMRGDTNPERVASRLPPDFKPDWSWRMGDTYVGYESATQRLALVDYPPGAVVGLDEVLSVEPVDESMLGLVHRWIVVTVPREPAQYRIWFRFSSAKRSEILARLAALTSTRGS
jgi:hypothetical protein